MYVTSNWGDAQLGQPIESERDLPSSDRFALRLVSMPPSKAADEELSPGASTISEAVVETAELLPPISRYSPERNVVDSLNILSADGPIPETLACFQMLTQLMKLPFRRDSIEKVLQDNIRRGLKPSLQLCGQLAASLGLHVMGAKVPAVSGTRLQVPSMLPWKEGFALVVASNEQGSQVGFSEARHGCACS